MLASIQQWMIGLGIMVAVSSWRSDILGNQTNNPSSNGQVMGVLFVEVPSPGAFHSAFKSFQL